jgi:hypothetical protein
MSVCLREPLTANRTYYVRTDGNDRNSGLVDSSSGAFQTIQKAVDIVCATLDMGLYQVAIEVRAGTYSEAVQLKSYVGSTWPILRGDTTTPANVTISTSTGNAIQLADSVAWRVEGFKVTSSTNSGFSSAANGVLSFQYIEFGACLEYHILAFGGGKVRFNGDYRISGNATAHMFVQESGSGARGERRTITLVGALAFSDAFAIAYDCASIVVPNMTFIGSATGFRFAVRGNSMIYVNGAGLTYLPGNLPGTSASGGAYA